MSTFTTFALLGRQPEFGLLELESRLGAEVIAPFGPAALTDRTLAGEYGGIEKSGQVLHQPYGATSLTEVIASLDVRQLMAIVPETGKINFGISVYGKRIEARELTRAATELKQRLRSLSNRSIRFIPPASGKTALSAAQLKFNVVLTHGFELVIVWHRDRVMVGVTTSYQDIDWYSLRDYGRPVRSAVVGMLPPKLAQVLVNSTHGPMVADPFVGTGVIVQEALLSGRAAWGSDLAVDMVQASQINLSWLQNEARNRGLIIPAPPTIECADARSVALPSAPLSIVSEGYLGRNFLVMPTQSQLAELRAQLRPLYVAALAGWAPQIPSGTEVTLCVPSWRQKGGWAELDLVDDIAQTGYTVKVFKHVPRSVRYARDDQIVGRRLLLLTRK